jgi:hypothetical protein
MEFRDNLNELDNEAADYISSTVNECIAATFGNATLGEAMQCSEGLPEQIWLLNRRSIRHCPSRHIDVLGFKEWPSFPARNGCQKCFLDLDSA